MRARWLLVLVVGSFVPALARADGMPEGPSNDISVGPSLAYAHDPEQGDGFVYGADLTLAFSTSLWASAGARSFESFAARERELLPYAEAGVWFGGTLGAGYTFDAGHSPSKLNGPHLFVGFPWPLGDKVGGFYVEPYYRPTFGADGVLHEVGVLAKWSSWDGR